MAVGEKASHRVSKVKKTMEKQDKTKSSVRCLKIKLVRSVIGHPRKQREVIKGLGLRKISSEVIREDCPEIRGMIRKISHLVSVEALEQK